MSKPKQDIPQIPRKDNPTPDIQPKPANGIERKPAGDLTRSALALLQSKYQSEAEVIANQAAKADGVDLAEGWKLDTTSATWVREAR